jgi:hypothetical protein
MLALVAPQASGNPPDSVLFPSSSSCSFGSAPSVAHASGRPPAMHHTILRVVLRGGSEYVRLCEWWARMERQGIIDGGTGRAPSQ